LNAAKCFGEVNRLRAELKLRPDGRASAYLAYCRAKDGNAKNTAEFYRRAVVDHCFDAAWAHNNWAHALILASPTAADLRLAIKECDAALRLDPSSRAARLNRCWATFRL